MIYISHNMDEIFQFADRVTILKNGLRQGTEEIQDVDKLKLIKMTYSFVLSREELEQDNRELFLLKKYNENIIRNLPIGVIILDQKKRISIVNFAAVKILALKDEVLMDQPVATLLERCGHGTAAPRSRKKSPPGRSTPGRSCTAGKKGLSAFGYSRSRTMNTSTWAPSS